jgi:hypothetical protein
MTIQHRPNSSGIGVGKYSAAASSKKDRQDSLTVIAVGYQSTIELKRPNHRVQSLAHPGFKLHRPISLSSGQPQSQDGERGVGRGGGHDQFGSVNHGPDLGTRPFPSETVHIGRGRGF